jgi:NDP-sugar pyrophosphorylase family protein
MSAVILAGGLGSRLGSLTADLPKPLISVAGKPLIEHVSDQLVAVGISDVVITVGYLGVMVEDWAKGRFLALRDGGTTMAESFLWAAQRCEHNTVLGLSCDTLVPRTALEHLCSFHGSSVAAATLLLTTESGQEQKKWSYQISKDGTLEAIKASNDVSSLERLGVVFDKGCLAAITSNFTSRLGGANDTFPGLEQLQRGWNFLLGLLIQSGFRVQAKVTDIPVYNVNTPEALAQAADFLHSYPGEFAL